MAVNKLIFLLLQNFAPVIRQYNVCQCFYITAENPPVWGTHYQSTEPSFFNSKAQKTSYNCTCLYFLLLSDSSWTLLATKGFRNMVKTKARIWLLSKDCNLQFPQCNTIVHLSLGLPWLVNPHVFYIPCLWVCTYVFCYGFVACNPTLMTSLWHHRGIFRLWKAPREPQKTSFPTD